MKRGTASAGSKRRRANSSASPKTAKGSRKTVRPVVKNVAGIGEVLFRVSERRQWREWLEKNAATKRRIHVHLPKKETGLPSLPYDVAVEEAMCFGWIDSTLRAMDKGAARAQQYTPRRKGSPYSQLNLERARWLLRRRMIPGAALRKELAAEVAKNDKEAKPSRKGIDAAIKKKGGAAAWKLYPPWELFVFLFI